MRNIPKWSLLFGAAIIVISVTVIIDQAEGGRSATYKNPIEPKMTPQLNLGKMNYDIFCSACHGKTAGGTNKGPTFISRIYHPGHHGDGAFYMAPKRGVRAHHWQFGDMKAVPGVNDEQLSTIVRYIRAVQKINGIF